MEANALPLHCNVCPSQPDFSDVSHLLTHISSKGHLSHYYKVKIRAGSDPESRQLVDTYDRWYTEWNVEALMSERMHHKDQKKKSRPRPPARRRKESATTACVQPPPESKIRRGSQNDVDIELQRSLLPLMAATSEAAHGQSPNQDMVRPRMHLWSTLHPASFLALPLDPPLKFGSEPGNIQEFPIIYDQTLQAEPGSHVVSNIFDDSVNDSSKLKGVYWPGMNLFDAASPEMRRKRNQKKDVSVVEQLEHNSSKVEPTEMIFTPSGSLKKSRPITGQIDLESSPLLAHAGLSARFPLSTRPALGARDVNSNKIGQGFAKKAKKCHAKAVPSDPPRKNRRSISVFNDAGADEKSSSLDSGLTFLNAGLPFNAHHSTVFSDFGNDSMFQPGATYQEPYFDEMTTFRDSIYTQTNIFASPKDSCAMLFNDNDDFLCLREFNEQSQDTGDEALKTKSETPHTT